MSDAGRIELLLRGRFRTASYILQNNKLAVEQNYMASAVTYCINRIGEMIVCQIRF